jgi:tRNA A-37 threonylcarbamoyl transferase component Bud32
MLSDQWEDGRMEPVADRDIALSSTVMEGEDGWEAVDEGFTNEVYRNGDRYRKLFEGWTPTSMAMRVRNTYRRVRNRDLSVAPSAEERYRNEIEAREVLEEYDTGTAPISRTSPEDADELWVETEAIDGGSLYDHVIEHWEEDRDAVLELVEGFGRTLKELHEEDCAFKDLLFDENVLVEDGEPYVIDLEFFTDDATAYEKAWDLDSFIATMRYLPPSMYGEVRESFEEGYGRNFSPLWELGNGKSGAVGAAGYHRDATLLENSLRNTYDDIRGRR